MATYTPRAFFSYSITKSPDKAATEGALARARTIVEAQGWQVVDALAKDVREVARKVREHLMLADFAVADATSSSPNVMFELGFAHALGYPVVLLVNPDALAAPDFAEYFRVLGQSSTTPIAADLGDLEYVTYPKGGDPEAAWQDYERALQEVLVKVRAHLTPEVCFFRRSLKEFGAGANAFMGAHYPSNPIIGFMAGRLHHTARRLGDEGENVFTTLYHYYPECLAAFADADPGRARAVRAVADLRGAPTESFWRGRDDPLQTRVARRVFVVPAKDLLNLDRSDDLAAIFAKQAASHDVWAVQSEMVPKLQHPIPDGVGYDVFTMPPDLVGGYVERPLGAGREKHLYVTRDSARYRDAETFITDVSEHAFPVRAVRSGKELRQAWFRVSYVGHWQAEWNVDVELRPAGYFAQYDQHIRCWIPQYEPLVGRTADVVGRTLLQRMRATHEPLDVLEIGCGTGALTTQIVQWIESLHAPYTAFRQRGVVRRYVAVDPADQMRAATRARLERLKSADWQTFVTVEHGRAPDDLGDVAGGRQFDVVCGSLVLHDLLDQRDSEKTATVLAAFRALLKPGGALVFGDIFPNDVAAQRDVQIARWHDWMGNTIGLDGDSVQAFAHANADMALAYGVDALARIWRRDTPGAPVYGTSVPGAPSWSPFRVLSAS